MECIVKVSEAIFVNFLRKDLELGIGSFQTA